MTSHAKTYQQTKQQRQQRRRQAKDETCIAQPNYKVTVIVPVYNCERELSRCINSLLAQTSNEFCVLFIDDGSTDNSLEVLRDVCEVHSDIFRYITQDNAGVSRTRNRGIREANSPYIMFIDNDDFIDPDYVEVHLRAIEGADAGASYSGANAGANRGKTDTTDNLCDTPNKGATNGLCDTPYKDGANKCSPLDVVVSGYRRVQGCVIRGQSERAQGNKCGGERAQEDACGGEQMQEDAQRDLYKGKNAQNEARKGNPALKEARKDNLTQKNVRKDETYKTAFEVRVSNDAWSPYRISAPWAHIYRTEFLRENNIEFFCNNIGEDVYFNFKALQMTRNVRSIDYVGYNWYYNTDSVSNTSQRGLQNNINVIPLLEQMFCACTENNLVHDVKGSTHNALGLPDSASGVEYNAPGLADSTQKSVNTPKNTSDVDNNNTQPILPLTTRYFFMRYVVWYLLFSGKDAEQSRFVECANELFAWLDAHELNNRPPLISHSIASEPLKNRISIWVFYHIHKLHLTIPFAKIYCKNSN